MKILISIITILKTIESMHCDVNGNIWGINVTPSGAPRPQHPLPAGGDRRVYLIWEDAFAGCSGHGCTTLLGGDRRVDWEDASVGLTTALNYTHVNNKAIYAAWHTSVKTVSSLCRQSMLLYKTPRTAHSMTSHVRREKLQPEKNYPTVKQHEIKH